MLDLTARSEVGANAPALTGVFTRQTSAPGLALPLQGFGLAARVLAVTIGFVLLAMALFYVTRLTAHREMLLHGKISAVQTTVDAFGLAGPIPAPGPVAKDPEQRRREVDGDRDSRRDVGNSLPRADRCRASN